MQFENAHEIAHLSQNDNKLNISQISFISSIVSYYSVIHILLSISSSDQMLMYTHTVGRSCVNRGKSKLEQ